MRASLTVFLLAALLGGCTPYIPVKDDFATTASVPVGTIPPEYAEFNSYNPGVNPLLAQQICATPYQPREERAVTANAGRLVAANGRCATHVPLYGE